MRAPSRHLLTDIDVVWLTRGDAAATRDVHDGLRRLRLCIPDRWMSASHARLLRAQERWMLDDPDSKNGCLVNGLATRRTAIADGDLIELGHTALLFREAPIPDRCLPDGQAVPITGESGPCTFVAELATSFAALGRVAPTDVPVLLLGETGTGKEVVALALHALSQRRGAFVAINCGALPSTLVEAELFGYRRGSFSGAQADHPGLVRSAEGGTLFLDEIGDLAPSSQAALLRVLQEREVVPLGEVRPIKVDVRLCAATHRDLAAMVEEGTFRRDLYSRLVGLIVELPPLRRRREDLGLLIRALLPRIPGGQDARFRSAAGRRLFFYDWPLNVRELERCLASAVALAGDETIAVDHLPEPVRGSTAPVPASAPPMRLQQRRDPESLRRELVELLTRHGGNVAAVARAMATGRMQIHRWARRLGIDLDAYRR
jgi:transcriptional regulator with GAF, ATPase, and Fis domain